VLDAIVQRLQFSGYRDFAVYFVAKLQCIRTMKYDSGTPLKSRPRCYLAVSNVFSSRKAFDHVHSVHTFVSKGVETHAPGSLDFSSAG